MSQQRVNRLNTLLGQDISIATCCSQSPGTPSSALVNSSSNLLSLGSSPAEALINAVLLVAICHNRIGVSVCRQKGTIKHCALQLYIGHVPGSTINKSGFDSSAGAKSAAVALSITDVSGYLVIASHPLGIGKTSRVVCWMVVNSMGTYGDDRGFASHVFEL